MFPHSNLPNCILSSDFFVIEIAFLLPFCRMCHIAERHACPSKSVSCLLDHYQHFVEKDGGLSTAIWNIDIVWLASVFLGEKTDKMDSWCGESTKLNVDYFCASVWFKVRHSVSIFKKKINEKLNLWEWRRKTWGRVAERCISFHHFRKARSTQS